MKKRISQLAAIAAMVIVTVALFTGNALADTETPADTSQIDPGAGQTWGGMMGGLDQEAWGQMIQHMNEVHGPELTGQMLAWMNEEGAHCTAGDAEGMMGRGFSGMMGQGFNGFHRFGSMMGDAFSR